MRVIRNPRTRATTAQLRSVYPWHFDGRLSGPGPMIGVDFISGGAPFTFDPFGLIEAGIAANPNVIVAGAPGNGKSAFGKVAAYWLAGAFGYRTVTIDVKNEYGSLARALGLQVIELRPGGSTRVNPMASDGTAEGAADRHRFMAALASVQLSRSLTPVEAAVLEEAVTLAAERSSEPLLGDLMDLLTDPPAELCTALQKEREEVLSRTDELRYGLRRLVRGALAGMFDAPTNVKADPSSPGLVVNIAGVGEDDELLRLVMLAGMRAVGQLRVPGSVRRTLMFNDETWRLGTTLQTVKWLQHSWKLGRQHGTSNWAMIHRFSDLAAQADDGTATAKIGRALIGDSDTHILFRHSKAEDAAHAVHELSLPPAVEKLLTELAPHRAVVHCGGRLAVVQAVLTPTLRHICNTNQALDRVA